MIHARIFAADTTTEKRTDRNDTRRTIIPQPAD